MINNKEEEREKKEGSKKRGRRRKDEKIVYELNKDQSKFFVDKKELKRVQELLLKANNKDFGSDVLFKDLCTYSLEKVTEKDLEKIQENSLSKMEKVERSLTDYNKKYGLKLTMGDYLLKKLNLN